MSSKYSVRTKTKEGYPIKLLIELIKNYIIKDPCFLIDETGISLINANAKNSVLISMKLHASKFLYYKCNEPLYIGTNLLHFHKMMKAVRKKIGLTLSIDRRVSEFIISPDKSVVKTFVKINQVKPTSYDIPEGYDSKPIIDTAKAFQEMIKNVNSVGTKTIELELIQNANGRKARFLCNGGTLYSADGKLGENEESDNESSDDESSKKNTRNSRGSRNARDAENKYEDDEENEDDENEDEENEEEKDDEERDIEHEVGNEKYKQTFTTSEIVHLLKIAGASQTVQFYITKGLPLKIKLDIGSLGTLEVYIKSKEMMKEESTEDGEEEEGISVKEEADE